MSPSFPRFDQYHRLYVFVALVTIASHFWVMRMRKCLIAGNWKLNGDHALCEQFASTEFPTDASLDIVICPPAVLLQSMHQLVKKYSSCLHLGAQDVSVEAQGAYTGEISAKMLHEAGAQYGIIGHSERRAHFAETNEKVATKMAQLLTADVSPIICVGESREARDQQQTLTVIEAQLSLIKAVLQQQAVSCSQIVIGYEPLWAIGSEQPATPEQAQQVHQHIRKWMADVPEVDALRIIYGGSVTADNSAALLAMPDIDGALVGGAALNIDSFLGLLPAV
ncbi:MAG: triose-phosphate isomerase [Pseudomonadota bacterium]|nr:triose-phosphate isomerase [Pseudomonadota bacterium]